MPPHRFKLELAGQTVYGLAFSSEAELETFERARTATAAANAVDTRPPPPPQLDPEPIHRGRPSYDAMLAAAVKALRRKLGRCDSLSDRARLVLKHLAETREAEDLPAASTVRAFLAARTVAENSAEKSAEKSNRARMRRTVGGTG